MTPRPSPLCMANGLSRNTPIIFRISFDAWVARKGTSVGGAKLEEDGFMPVTERARLGDMEESSMIKQPSGSSGSSTLTEGCRDVGIETGDDCEESGWVVVSGIASCWLRCRSG